MCFEFTYHYSLCSYCHVTRVGYVPSLSPKNPLLWPQGIKCLSGCYKSGTFASCSFLNTTNSDTQLFRGTVFHLLHSIEVGIWTQGLLVIFLPISSFKKVISLYLRGKCPAVSRGC